MLIDNVSFDGFSGEGLTFEHIGLVRGTDEGKVVKLTADKTVGLCVADDVHWYGKVTQIDKDGLHCTVVRTGVLCVSYSGALGASQTMLFVADGNGGLKLDAVNGLPHQVLDSDTDNNLIWIER